MKKFICFFFVLFAISSFSQQKDSIVSKSFKKKVLDKTEVDVLMSYYTQEGQNSAVGGGIGTEELWDATPTIVISTPLNADDVLTIDAGLSTYTSASSSNLNPFDLNKSGASGGGDGDDDDDDDDDDRVLNKATSDIIGTPWLASSGASKSDVLGSLSVVYQHADDSRNNLWNTHVSFSTEYDYTSFGFGGGYTHLSNLKNTELGFKANIYLDQWRPEYPTELKTFEETNGNLNAGFFNGVPIVAANAGTYNPVNFSKIKDKGRNSYSISVSFSQILSKKLQTSVFFDLVKQQGQLATPYHRIYFSDTNKFYIGNYAPNKIYDSPTNTDFFMLADDIERLPDNRFKVPVGIRLHYYINEFLTLRNYYRFYWDDWGVMAHTYNVELPVKLGRYFTLYPSFRYYIQNKADYFAPFNQHLSTETYYTSDYDLSDFSSNQYGIGLKYTNVLMKRKLWKIGLKSIDVRYNYYKRTTGLQAGIISSGIKYIID